MSATRTIYLLQTNGGQWLIRVADGHQKIIAEEDLASASAAERAFILEGRHQPFAHMVLIVEGRRPRTIRSGSRSLPPISGEAEEAMVELIRAARKKVVR